MTTDTQNLTPAAPKMPENSTATQPQNGRRSKGGAPKFNVNRLASGRHAKQPRLSRYRRAKEQRPDLVDTFRDCERFENQLTQLVSEARGRIDIVDAIAIDTAAGWLFVARRADDLKLEQGIDTDKALDRAYKAATARDRCLSVVKALEIPRPSEPDPWADPATIGTSVDVLGVPQPDYGSVDPGASGGGGTA